MTILLDDLYLCPITGQNVQVSEDRVECPAIIGSSSCRQNTPESGGSGMCLVYITASMDYAQSQPKCTGIVEGFSPRTEISCFVEGFSSLPKRFVD